MLCRAPQRSYEGAGVHDAFVILAYACVRGHMGYMTEQSLPLELGRQSTLGDYGRQISNHNRNRVIIFFGRTYGIFFLRELLLLLGIPSETTNPGAASSVEELFARMRKGKG